MSESQQRSRTDDLVEELREDQHVVKVQKYEEHLIKIQFESLTIPTKFNKKMLRAGFCVESSMSCEGRLGELQAYYKKVTEL
jgi:hypothetical protein